MFFVDEWMEGGGVKDDLGLSPTDKSDAKVVLGLCEKSFIWLGPNLRMYIRDPELIQEILARPDEFLKAHPNPIRDSIIGGLFVSEGHKWAKIKQIINPAFSIQNLKQLPGKKKDICNPEEQIDLVSKMMILHLPGKRKKLIEMGEGNCNDLLGILLELNLKEIEEHRVGMSMEDVIEESREEILQVFGKGEVDFEGLKILTMILNEVLRLYSPVVMLPRATFKRTKLGNMIIPSSV
ncbi:cytochrome P450 [Artemisia annua]|uniref:Cytochrome P450 n=1 Tax=Artemisia annua TaxID=35608 RepID=A0A2U1NU61_ARTAN|nr:cytochrome P450 [Artemisia annua]